jgi:hypothetical protein
MKSSHTPTKKRRLDKGNPSPQSKTRSKNQDSPGDSKEVTTERYATCWEEISEIETDSIQPCPIIPDYKKPTTSALPIVVRTPVGEFCIDGWNFVEQAKAAGQATIRCHISQIDNHSNIELAIRKAAIRVIPQGGKCSHAEQVRNTNRLYQELRKTSDNLVLFSHGGDRRGVAFTSCRENNIRIILATRLNKSPTTIAKYLQHSEYLNNATMESLVEAGAPKLLFESFQVQKQVEIAASRAEHKDETAIVEEISNQMSTWLNEFRRLTTSKNPQPEGQQSLRTNQSVQPAKSNPSINRRRILAQSQPGASQGASNRLAVDPTPINTEEVYIELKRIGEAIIEVADNSRLPIHQKIETVRKHVIMLSTLIHRFRFAGSQEGTEKGGAE